MAVKGNNILILVNGTAVAGCKAHNIDTQSETIEKASSSQSIWKEFIPGRKEWGVDTNYLLTAVSDIRKVLIVGSIVTLLIRDRSSNATVSGSAIVTKCEQSYARDSLARGSFSFKGTGALAWT